MILRLLILLLLAIFLVKGCKEFTNKKWIQDRDNQIKNYSTLKIPRGDEKEIRYRNKKFIIDKDTTVFVSPGTYNLFIADNGSKVDHDKVNVFLNGKLLKKNIEIYREATQIPLKNLRYGENQIDFGVVSNGNYGNCTAKIVLINRDDTNIKIVLKINNILNHVSRIKLILR